jgi:hypothetical protein
MAAPADDDVAAVIGALAGLRGRVVAARDGLVVIDLGTGSDADVQALAEDLIDTVQRGEAAGQATVGASRDHEAAQVTGSSNTSA